MGLGQYSKWIITRWYFWLVCVLEWIFFKQTSEMIYYSITEYILGFLTNCLFMFMIFLIFRLIFAFFGILYKKARGR